MERKFIVKSKVNEPRNSLRASGGGTEPSVDAELGASLSRHSDPRSLWGNRGVASMRKFGQNARASRWEDWTLTINWKPYYTKATKDVEGTWTTGSAWWGGQGRRGRPGLAGRRHSGGREEACRRHLGGP